jgi:hypothetical protein
MAYLSSELRETLALQDVLSEYAMPGPRVVAYVAPPQWARPDWAVGGKVSYFDKTGLPEQFGQIVYVSEELRESEWMAHVMRVLGHDIARGIRKHEEGKKPLPIRALTAADREDLCLPF